MYFYALKVLRNNQNQITGYKCLARTGSQIAFSQFESISIASNLKIDPDYVLAQEVNGKIEISEDTTKKNSDNNIAIRMKRIEFGHRLIAIMSIRNDSKNLTGPQIIQLSNDFSDINKAWLNGSIATSKALIQALTPDGTILTTADKTAIMNEINANWSQLGYE